MTIKNFDGLDIQAVGNGIIIRSSVRHRPDKGICYTEELAVFNDLNEMAAWIVAHFSTSPDINEATKND